MGRMSGWWIVAFLAALPTLATGAVDDIGKILAWVELRPRYNHIEESATLYVELHRFHSDVDSLDFGREANVGLTWAIRPSAQLRLQHARYDPGSGRADPEVRKTWLTLTWTY